MKALESDESAQIKGFIKINYHVGCRKIDPKFFDAYRHRRMHSDALPHRVVAAHFCYDVSELQPMALFMQNIISKDHRLRFRTHYGECWFIQPVFYRLF